LGLAAAVFCCARGVPVISSPSPFSRIHRAQIAGEFTDHASGAKESRPALNRLMNAAAHRRFDVLFCWKLDRVGRSLRHLVNLLADLEALGISFVSLGDNLDLTTPSGRLMFHVIAAMAQFERSLIQERVKAGLRNAHATGKRLRRPPKDLVARGSAGEPLPSS